MRQFSCSQFFSLIPSYSYAQQMPLPDAMVAVRTAAFAVRAVYTVRYKPALAGTWLAFNNAGFGANTAALCLALGTWYACPRLSWLVLCLSDMAV